MEKYTIGIDFGTESGRVLIVNIDDGSIKGQCVIPYAHGVITEMLPTNDGTRLPRDYALQHPGDYLEVIMKGIPHAIKDANISSSQIIGIGIDFTSSTMVAVDEKGKPLCFHKEFQNNPHAWVKLWKHHGPKKETEEMFKLASSHKESWLKNYGYNISTEWFIPKCYEVFCKDREVYEKASLFLEAGDWIVSQLTGKVVRSNCSLGFKAFWNENSGFPVQFFEKLHPEFKNIVSSKLKGKIGYIGEKAGVLTDEMSSLLGLPKNLPVAVAIIDAHSAVLGVGSSKPHQLTMVMGTSTCHIMLSKKEIHIPGISGVVKNSIIPRLYAYEAGQSAVGDLFGWFAKQVPESLMKEAKEQGISVFDLLEKKASHLEPGQSGLIALDWHNGNRSILSDADLSGMIVGLTLASKPEDIYRAYMEATAFGAKIIISNYEQAGLKINEIFACGGLPQKNDLLMQIYADVLNKEIIVSASDYTPAVGAAILGSVAAGKENGGYDSVEEAVKRMKQPILKTYKPILSHVEKYKKLFQIYQQLHNYFGITKKSWMKDLKSL
ncbi:ribulokinase [Aeribacillus pallidus]|nr:ribulokinase [Aeribacillus pallidus]